MPLPLLAIAGLGFATGGGIEGIVGGKKRRNEEGTAKRKQAEAERNYFDFDYNQDVGAINNPYAKLVNQQQDYLTRQADQNAANQLNAAQQQRGGFAATQNLLTQQNAIGQQNAQQINQLRQQGSLYVEQQRQSRIADRYDQAETLLARSENRLAQATRARQQATQSLIKGVGAGVTAGVSAGIAGGFGSEAGFDWKKGLKGSGLLPSSAFGTKTSEELLTELLAKQNGNG